MANDYEIQIKVKATSEDAALQLVQKQMGDVATKIKAAAHEGQAAGSSFTGLAKNIGGLAASFIGLNAILGFIKSSFQEAKDAAKENATIANGLRVTVNATDEAIAAAQEWADKIEVASTVSRGQLAPALIQLTEKTKDLTQAQNWTAIAAGAAAMKQTDFSTAIDNITKILDGRAIKSTDVFSQKLKEAAKDGMITSGEMAKLVQIYGDAGAALDDDNTKLERSKIAWANTKEAIGGALQSVLIPILPVLRGLSIFLGMVVAGTVGLGNAFAELLIMIPEGLARIAGFLPIVGAGINKWADGLTDLRGRMRATAGDYMQAVMDGVVSANSKAETAILGVKAQMQGFTDIVLPKQKAATEEVNYALEQQQYEYEKLIALLDEAWELMGGLQRTAKKPINPVADLAGIKEWPKELQDMWAELQQINNREGAAMNAEELAKKLTLLNKISAAQRAAGIKDMATDRMITHAKIQFALQAAQQITQSLMQTVNAHSAAGKAIFRVSQAISLAQAIMNTYLGVSKAIADYSPPISTIMAAIQLASGLAAVAQIASQKIPSAAGGMDIPAGASGILKYHEKEMVLPKDIAETFREAAAARSIITSQTYEGSSQININALTGAYGLRDAVVATKAGNRYHRALEI